LVFQDFGDVAGGVVAVPVACVAEVPAVRVVAEDCVADAASVVEQVVDYVVGQVADYVAACVVEPVVVYAAVIAVRVAFAGYEFVDYYAAWRPRFHLRVVAAAADESLMPVDEPWEPDQMQSARFVVAMYE
jgi:hypothetical protein